MLFDDLFKAEPIRVRYLLSPTGSATIGLMYVCEAWWRLARLYVRYIFFYNLQTYETTPNCSLRPSSLRGRLVSSQS